jgi:tryptophan synthase alpha chain
MTRIDQAFKVCQGNGRKALVIFVSAGDPDLAFTEELIPAIAEAGADIIEIGVPFSDPMADGPAIQAASQRALKAGTTLAGILAMAERLRKNGVQTPFVLFSYYNVLLQYGVERLAAESAAKGIDAWLVVDMPAEEEDEIAPVLKQHGLQKITLLAPTTPPDRMARLAARAEGFIYYITVTGVTGARDTLPPDLARHLREVKQASTVPVAAGFGVSTPAMARQVGAEADGVVVGSKLIQTIAAAENRQQAKQQAVDLVTSLAGALRNPS